MCEFLHALQKPFPAEDIEWRVDHAKKTFKEPQALVLAYVTNRAIMERLDQVFGIAGWKNEYREWRDKGVLCTITCKVNDEWIAKADGADSTNIEATKGGFSASMKRTAVQWGIGRYLYNLEQTWVPILANGTNYINTSVGPKDKKEWIKGYWNTPLLPLWALPEGYEYKEITSTQAHETYNQGEHIDPIDEDLAAIQQASEELYPTTNKPAATKTTTTTKAQSGGMKRVLDLRAKLQMDWKALNDIASSVLEREVKYPLKDHVKTEEEWKKIEDCLLQAS